MAKLSENFSEKKRRGRPRAFSEADERFFLTTGAGEGCRTRRGKMNAWYATRAIAALEDNPECAWLGCGDFAAVMAGTLHLRFTILSELGRLDDPELIRDVAHDICQEKPRAAEAVRMIRERRTGRVPTPSVSKLVDALTKTADDYRADHWWTPYSMVRDALHKVEAAVVMAEKQYRAKRSAAKATAAKRKKG